MAFRRKPPADHAGSTTFVIPPWNRTHPIEIRVMNSAYPIQRSEYSNRTLRPTSSVFVTSSCDPVDVRWTVFETVGLIETPIEGRTRRSCCVRGVERPIVSEFVY
jgi:hypothetical protein